MLQITLLLTFQLTSNGRKYNYYSQCNVIRKSYIEFFEKFDIIIKFDIYKTKLNSSVLFTVSRQNT